MPAAEAVLTVTRRYQDHLLATSGKVIENLDRLWDGMGPDLSTADELDRILRTTREVAASSADGYMSFVTGAGAQGLGHADIDPQFKTAEIGDAIREARERGESLEDAAEAGRRRMHALARDYTTSSARLAGDVYVAKAGLTVERWRRVPDANACPWCRKVAGDHYRSSSTADFGHRNCGCSALPVVKDVPASDVVDEAVAQEAEIEAQARSVPQPGRGRQQVLTPEQYAELVPRWSPHKQKRVMASLRKTPEGKALSETLTRFQSGSARSIPLLRTDIQKRLAGEALEAGRAARVDNLLDAIGNAPDWAPEKIYRGMRLDGSADDIVARYAASDTLDLNLSSFSSNKKLAEGFTSTGAGQKGPRTKTQTGVLIELKGEGVKALPIENLAKSSFFADEKEWVTGGRFAVDSVSTRKDGTVVLKLRQLAALGD